MGMATPFACEQEPAKNRRREPPPGCGEHLRHGHRASPQDAQDPTAGDNVLQDCRHVVVGHDTGDFEEDKFVGGGSTILERLRAALPWSLGSRASALWYGAASSAASASAHALVAYPILGLLG